MVFRPEAAKDVYRIVQGHYSPFDGTGTYLWGSRWVSPGRYVVHAAESYALAVLENLVHWQTNSLPRGLVCVRATIPGDIAQEEAGTVDAASLASTDYAQTRVQGDRWYDDGRTVVLWVPSAVSPYERNVLFNQRHPDFGKIEVSPPVDAAVDPRLTRPRVPD